MGPILIFDKSLLESLNPDEAAWLDQFFICNITPLFYIETLADLEKEVRTGRTPEQVVGSIAYRTPDLNAQPNADYKSLIASELTGTSSIDMRYGRPIIRGGRRVELEGQKGIVFEPAPEQQAMARWQNGEFLEVERLQAKEWREELSLINPEKQRALFSRLVEGDRKPKSLAEVKALADSMIDGPRPLSNLELGLGILGALPKFQEQVFERWRKAGEPPIREFAPYFRHVLGVDLFFYLGLAAGLISSRRTNKIDIAYLYYLPFCMVFTSGDKLHREAVPLFLRDFQTFVWGPELKEGLGQLDRIYSLVPDRIREKGTMHFAAEPPADDSLLVTQLWDRYLPRWRELAGKNEARRDSKHDAETVAYVKRLAKAPAEAKDVDNLSSDEREYMIVHRRVQPRRGKWTRVPPEALEEEGAM